MLLYSNPAPVITTSKMCLFLLKLVIFSLIGARAGEMSPAPTPEFRRCFPQWVNASQVKVICNTTVIAQHCDPDQICPNKSKPGVSLEKDTEGVCLTITNCSYDSWSCEALSYIDGKEFRGKFTVNVTCHQLIIIALIIISLIILLCIHYNQQVKRFWKNICDICRQQCINRTPKEKDIELEETKSLK